MSELRVLEVALEMVEEVMKVVRVLERQDRNLAQQLRRAAMSVGGQIGEAQWARKGNRPAKLQGAMAEAKETKLHLRMAVAAGYVDRRLIARAWDRADCVCGSLYKLVYRPRVR